MIRVMKGGEEKETRTVGAGNCEKLTAAQKKLKQKLHLL